jgi:hypothetical protein
MELGLSDGKADKQALMKLYQVLDETGQAVAILLEQILELSFRLAEFTTMGDALARLEGHADLDDLSAQEEDK